MAQDYHPGQIVPDSGIYRIDHNSIHTNMPAEITLIKGRRFPICPHCKSISYQLAHAALHVGETALLKEPT